ncbi:hypothetical protein H9P43_000209 [Blastocladiella emersonii ATCC 22665]|nr:hypothetical protein H9P43_000209 [Blastocladiella emersonii ATCC 22665]
MHLPPSATRAAAAAAATTTRWRPRALVQTAITSPSNPTVKHLASLVSSKPYRLEHEQLVVFGRSAISDLARHAGIIVVATFGSGPTAGISLPASRRLHPPHTQISREVARKIAGTASATAETLALVDFPAWASSRSASTPAHEWLAAHLPPTAPRLLVLNGLQDPGNVGTLFRTASAFGWHAVALTGAAAVDPWNDKVMRAAKATALVVPWRRLDDGGEGKGWDGVAEWCRRQSRAPRVWIADTVVDAAAAEAPVPSEEAPPTVLILSGEAHGVMGNPIPVSALVNAGAEVRRVAVPMPGGVADSLNVAMAGSVLMWELSVRGNGGLQVSKATTVPCPR